MSNFNGFIASLTKDGSSPADLLTGRSEVTTVSELPMKYFPHGQFSVVATEGVSGVFAVRIVGYIGGASITIAGRTNITAAGSFPAPLFVFGQSGVQNNPGIPRPSLVLFDSARNASGFTASVFFSGDY